jgi:polyisoprenoid-binding protein YceI
METNIVEIEQGTYVMDSAHSEIGFRVKHLGLSTVKGSFKEATATLEIGEDGIESLKTTATIDVKSIDTKNDDRDNHLRSDDFFAAEKYGEITFESTGVKTTGEDTFELRGDLTIRGTTRPIVLDATFLGEATDPWGNNKIAFEASGAINRKKYGLNWNQVLEAGGLLVGEQVKILLDIQAARQ